MFLECFEILAVRCRPKVTKIKTMAGILYYRTEYFQKLILSVTQKISHLSKKPIYHIDPWMYYVLKRECKLINVGSLGKDLILSLSK